MLSKHTLSWLLSGAAVAALVLVLGLAVAAPAAAGQGNQPLQAVQQTPTTAPGAQGAGAWGSMLQHMRQIMGTLPAMGGGMVSGRRGAMGNGYGMMSRGADSGYGACNGGSYGSQGAEQQGRGPASMMQGVGSLGRTMTGMMQQMQRLTGSQGVEQNPELGRSMRTMQNGMGTMMQGYEGLVNGMSASQHQRPSE